MWSSPSYSTLWGYYPYSWTTVYVAGPNSGHGHRRRVAGLQRHDRQAGVGRRRRDDQPQERAETGRRPGEGRREEENRQAVSVTCLTRPASSKVRTRRSPGARGRDARGIPGGSFTSGEDARSAGAPRPGGWSVPTMPNLVVRLARAAPSSVLARDEREPRRAYRGHGWPGTAGPFAARTPSRTAGCSAPGGCSRVSRPARSAPGSSAAKARCALLRGRQSRSRPRLASEGIRVAQRDRQHRSRDARPRGAGAGARRVGRRRRRACAARRGQRRRRRRRNDGSRGHRPVVLLHDCGLRSRARLRPRACSGARA